MKKTPSHRKPKKVEKVVVHDDEVYLTVVDLRKILAELLDIRKIIDNTDKINLELFDKIMSHINRHEAILMEMKGVTNFGDKPKSTRVDGDEVLVVLDFLTKGIEHLRTLFRKHDDE